jgi:mRNA-degrading endonuclease RelE of RelBE toxin-antitoxin system
MKRFDAVAILDAIERHLRAGPERTSRASIKRLRAQQETASRRRARDYRMFYDVVEERVEIVQILHKSETRLSTERRNNEDPDHV